MMPKDYACDGQMNLWEWMATVEREAEAPKMDLREVDPDDSICEHSHHKCNCEELWTVAEMDGIECNRCCCIGCAVQFCGARCSGSSEPKDHPPVDPDVASGKKKPCEYDFERFIGQKVWCYLTDYDEPQIGEITAFDHYYTEVKVHYEYYALTTLTVKPCILPSLEETIADITQKYGLSFTTYQGEWNLPDNPTIYKHVFKRNSVLEISEGHYWSPHGKDYQGARYIAVDWEGWHESASRPCDDIAEVYHAVEFSIYRNEHMKKPKKDENDE